MNFRTLDLNLLRVFDVVMTERSVTHAADRLAMTQPAVSNALRRLREATQGDLFIPSSTGVLPTPHAEALWPSVRTALGGLRQVFEPQAFDPRQDPRSFTLAMADATVAVIAPPLVRALDAERSLAALRFVPLASRDPRGLLERGDPRRESDRISPGSLAEQRPRCFCGTKNGSGMERCGIGKISNVWVRARGQQRNHRSSLVIGRGVQQRRPPGAIRGIHHRAARQQQGQSVSVPGARRVRQRR